MVPKWAETTLGQVVEVGGGFIQTGPFGSQLHASDYVSEGIPVIMPVNLAGNRVSLDDIARIREADADRLSRHIVQAGDIVYSRRGDVTRKALITENEAGMFCGTGCLLIRPGKGIDPQFLAYHLSTPANQEWIMRHAIGATMPNLNTGILGSVPLQLPSRETQKSIAHILGTLDDKIELNRQMNATLEAMAQALFKSWFVDFDPVIDNALAAGNPIPEPLHKRAEARAALGDQRKPLPEAIQKQFPDSFVFNEDMGWVPEGWETRSIEEIATAVGMGPFGSNIKVDTFVDAGVPIVNGQHLNDTLLTEGKHNFITEAHAARLGKSLAHAGDIVFTHRGTIGQVSLVPVSPSYEKFVVSQSQMFMTPNTELVTSTFLIYFFRSHIGQHRLLANASQVGVPSIARPSSHLKSIRLILPGMGCLSEFDRISKNWLDTILANRMQIETLSNIRDMLLPKLLSGQLRIPDAEKLAEAISA